MTATRRFVLGTALAVAGAAKVGTLIPAPSADPYAGATLTGSAARTTVLDVTEPEFGAKGDAVLLGDLVVRAGSPVIDSATAPFTSTERDRGKTVLWRTTEDGVGTGVIDTVTSSTSAVLRGPASAASRADGGPNTNAVIGTDNTKALDNAFTAAQAAAAGVAPERRLQVTAVRVHVPRGAFLFTSLQPFQQAGVSVTGEGRFSSLLVSAAKDPWLQLAPAGASSDLYQGTATDWTFEDLHFINPVHRSGSTEGRRTGRAIQDNGSGGLRISGCMFTGLEVGFCGAHGSDFTTIRDSYFYLCDTGYYFGPGSQQVEISKTDASQCREGAVFEGAPQWHIGGASSFEDPSVAAVTIAGPTSGTTRYGLPVDAPGAFYSGTFVIDGATWFETNSGGNGRLTPRLIWMHGDGPFGTPAEGLVVRDGYVIAGGEQRQGGTAAFIEYSSARTSEEPVLIDGLRIGGTFLNSVFRMSGEAPTSSPRVLGVRRPKEVALLQGPTAGAKVLEPDGSTTWPVRISPAAPDTSALRLVPARASGTRAPLLAVGAAEETRSGIAADGALLEAFSQADPVNGVVTVDAAACNHCTSTLSDGQVTIRITNAPSTAGQRLTVELVARGGARAVRWPAECRFAGGAAPQTVAANSRTAVTFGWNPRERLWIETARSEAIGI
ncbi:hypothetical protein D1781_17230 [Amnibacterium setariae]|uniref:Uncharacterized protein n=1 Tax=Amnibacterium setariae TaxID=2306585 RepID=A0A3A1TRW0_9MICO|nr:hypothetical protein D1781_17230 [Amnibacterium setariae]